MIVLKYNIDLIVLTILESIIGIGAFFGGISMLQDPTGISMFQQDLRSYIILPDFFLPGLWLIFVYGFGTFIFLIGIWLKYRFAWIIGLLISISEIIWIGIQIVLLYSVGFIFWQLLIPLIALIALGFLLLNQNRSKYFLNGKLCLPKYGI